MKRNSTIVIVVLVAGVAAAALAAWAVKSFTGGSATDKAMAELRAQPLIGPVLADNPALEARVRSAVEEYQ